MKKTVSILLLLIVSICAISAVSATDDVAGAIATEDLNINEITAEDVNIDEISSNYNEEDELSQSDDVKSLDTAQDNADLTADESRETLSLVYASFYSVKFNSEYEISSTAEGKITYYRNPCTYSSEAYHYYIGVYDVNSKVVYSKEIQGTNTKAGNFVHTISANTIVPGTYVLAAINYDDGKVMSTSVLKVSGTAVITANDFESTYLSGAKMTARITDQTTGKPLSSASINVVFTNTKTKKSVSKTYTADSNGYISFEPPVGAGTWTVTFTSGSSHVTASAVKKTASVNKASVKIKAYKVTEYKGFKTTLKAKVTLNGKNVKEGKVIFKINGKTYKANVKNGIATKKIKLSKVKTYKYTAQFKADNFKTSKKAKANAVLKKRIKTKIIFENRNIDSFATKKVTIKVLTSDGKKVKNGVLRIKANGETSDVTVKNGKATAYIYGLGMKHFKGFTSNGETYKKSITKTVKFKYIPKVHKYASSGKTAKVTSKFKCLCGKTSTHYHYTRGYYITYKYRINIV